KLFEEPKEFGGIWPSLSEVLNGIPVGVLIMDKAGVVIAINDLLAGWLGIAAEDVKGRRLHELPCVGGQSAHKNILLMLEAGREFDCIHDSRFSVSIRPLHSEQGDVAGAMAVFEDKGYCRELEQAVIKAERLAILGQLCAITMHEIKNPLAAVRGYLQLFKRELKDSPRAARVDTMLAAVDRINAIIADFLRLARPAVPKRRPCELRSVIERAIKLIEGEAKRCGIRFLLSCDESLPQFILDEEQFEQVLLNVFKNACEAMPGGGEVVVRATADPSGKLCRIEIEDTGPGMTEEQRRRAFEPFFTTKESGTGLGLYISRLIVRNHGGDMRVENRANKGCRVVIFLPVAGSLVEEGLA
ncbi:MAG: two-component system sensor histidine kinase NtrB, partial [Thermacetogeniaceae bacterium]